MKIVIVPLIPRKRLEKMSVEELWNEYYDIRDEIFGDYRIMIKSIINNKNEMRC